MRYRAAGQSRRRVFGRSGADATRLGGVAGLALAVVFSLGAGGLFGGSGSSDVANAAGTVIEASPGGVSAEFVAGPEQNGVATLVPVISQGGAEVYRDAVAYSTRQGVAITWQPDGQALWVVTSDVGTFKVSRDGDTWTKVASTDLPAEVRDRLGR